jgi:N6-adenosine-specific RNA methylase IME4
MSRAPKADNLPLPPIPDEKFGTIAIDPPWHFASRAPVANHHIDRNPSRHYATMDLEHIAAIPIKEMAAKDCHVMLWITGPLLAAGVHNSLFSSWGVRVSSMLFVWIKLWPKVNQDQFRTTPLLECDLAYGNGFTTMQNAEYCVLGRIGSPSRQATGIRQIILDNRREHSRKPDAFYKRARAFGAGPYLDAFPGEARGGWTPWGWSHREGERPEQAAQRD